MAARDEGTTLDPDDARRDGRGAEPDGDEESPAERAVTAAGHGIHQIADKVKGILRSDR